MERVATRSLLVMMLLGAYGWPHRGAGQENASVQGEIIDMVSYMTKGNGAAPEEYAQLCAKKGEPIGLLTDDGQLYLLVDDHNNPDVYDVAKTRGGKRTDVTGKKFIKQGVASIVVEAVKGP